MQSMVLTNTVHQHCAVSQFYAEVSNFHVLVFNRSHFDISMFHTSFQSFMNPFITKTPRMGSLYSRKELHY